MPRQRSPERDKAFQMWLESKGKKALRMIAEELGVLEKTIACWKVRDKWEDQLNAVLQKDVRSTAKKNKGGAPKGNTNSKGKGNVPPAPPDNKRALKTGEFERILFSNLTPEEQEMIQQAVDDPILLIQQEILLGAVREKRMLGRIGILSDLERTNRNGMIAVSTRVTGSMGSSPLGGQPTINPKQVVNETQAALESIIGVEDALTRVQIGRQNAIVALHRMGIDIKKLELLKRKDGFSDDEEIEDDGFIAALNAEGGKVLEHGMDEPQDTDP